VAEGIRLNPPRFLCDLQGWVARRFWQMTVRQGLCRNSSNHCGLRSCFSYQNTWFDTDGRCPKTSLENRHLHLANSPAFDTPETPTGRDNGSRCDLIQPRSHAASV
jgi:hypothetical protein